MNSEVIYCEWLAMGEPIERKMEMPEAIERFNIKIKAIEGYLFKDLCFIGIKDLSNNWIMKN